MSVKCKAYLLGSNEKLDSPQEIRTFPVDEGAVSNYEYLRKKIATVFPNLSGEENSSVIQLLWRDSDGDLIAFSSDEELVEGLSQVGSGGVFKIYIKKKAGGNEFPWKNVMEDVFRSVGAENNGGFMGFHDFSQFHPYARGRGGGCRGNSNFSRRGCFPRRGGCCSSPADRFPGGFGGFMVWDDSGRNTGSCGQSQFQSQCQFNPNAGTSKQE